MKKNRTSMLALLILFYFLVFVSILLDSQFLVLICVALLVFYFALKKSNRIHKTEIAISSNSTDNNYIRLVRFLFIFICIPFIIIGISIFLFGLIEHENFLIFFGLFFFTIPLIILVSSLTMTSKMKQVSFDNDDSHEEIQEKMPLLFNEDPHSEHDAFINDYSSKDKECFEHEIQSKKKKKKKFKLFNEPEWDDENSELDL